MKHMFILATTWSRLLFKCNYFGLFDHQIKPSIDLCAAYVIVNYLQLLSAEVLREVTAPPLTLSQVFLSVIQERATHYLKLEHLRRRITQLSQNTCNFRLIPWSTQQLIHNWGSTNKDNHIISITRGG